MFDSLLRPYQQQTAADAFAILQRRSAYLDASETGTGKTYTTLAVCKKMGVVPVVVAPKTVLESWLRVAKYLGHQLVPCSYGEVRGSRRAKGAQVRTIKETSEELDIATGELKEVVKTTTKRYSLSNLGREVPWGKGSFWRWDEDYDTAIFDEVQNCGGETTISAKMLIGAKRQFGNVIGLSATATHTPLRMKALGYVLGLHNMKDYRDWLYANGCTPGWAGGWVFGDPKDPAVGEAYMRKLHEQIFPDRGVRLRKAEIPGFPVSQISTRLVEVDEADRARVEALEKERRLHGRTHMELMQRLELLLVPDVLDMAKYYEGTVQIFFVNFRKTAELIAKKLGCPIIWGATTAEDLRARQRVIDAVQMNKVQNAVVTYQTGGPGIGLHDPLGFMGRTTWLFPNFDGTLVCQAEGRVHRDGAAPSQQFLVGFAGTYHDEVLESVAGKLNRMEILNDGMLLRP